MREAASGGLKEENRKQIGSLLEAEDEILLEINYFPHPPVGVELTTLRGAEINANDPRPCR
jgi:hypothetical protein